MATRVTFSEIAFFVFITCTSWTFSTHAATVVAGSEHSCAITSSGGVRCTGDNTYGQLGDGTTISRLVHRDVLGLQNGVNALAAGAGHTCALTMAGEVYCWGFGGLGELGDGSLQSFSEPVHVDLSGRFALDISAGSEHTCAIVTSGGSDRQVLCWGHNFYGQLGTGNLANAAMPKVIPLQGTGVAMSLAAGARHTCVLTSSDIQCWGNNTYHQLGDGTANSRPTAATVSNSAGFQAKSLVAGSFHTCALLQSEVRCWGENSQYTLGVGDSSPRTIPVKVAGLEGLTVASLGSGTYHTCALTEIGVMCWGSGYLGEQGNGALDPVVQPHFPVPGTGNGFAPSALSTGSEAIYQCVTHGAQADLINCWGFNSRGQFGNGTRGIRMTPTLVRPLAAQKFVDVVSGGDFSCATVEGGQIDCWGGSQFGQLGNSQVPLTFRATPGRISSNDTYSTLSAGTTHACAITQADHHIQCWGRGYSGQLGTGLDMDSFTPATIALAGNATTASGVSAGSYHSCATTTAGLQCWGSNTKGQIGNSAVGAKSSVPVLVGLANGASALQVSAGNQHTCAVTSAGAIQCWGDDTYGQLGIVAAPGQNVPTIDVPLADGASASFVSAGIMHTCAVTLPGDVQCWGHGTAGELGQGAYANSVAPQKVTLWSADGSTTKAKSVATALYFTCAQTSLGDVQCWGLNQFGALGGGSELARNTPKPVNMLGGKKVQSLSATLAHVCAVDVDGDAQCWGDNGSGNLGNGEHGVWPEMDMPSHALDTIFADGQEGPEKIFGG